MQDRQVRVAVIGAAGNQAVHFLGMCQAAKEVDLRAVVEGFNREDAAARALQYGGPECLVLETVDDLVVAVEGGLGLDLAIVVSRPEGHAEAVIALLALGLVVLCEKPPTLSLGEMLAIRDAELASAGRVVWNFQLEEQWKVMRAAYEDGEFGSVITSLLARWIRGYVSPRDVNQAAERTRRGQAGSPMFDLSHAVHAAVCFVPGIEILRVLGTSQTEVFDVAGTQVEQIVDTLTATCRLPGAGDDSEPHEFQIRVEVGWNAPLVREADLQEVYLDVLGTLGSGKLNLKVGDEESLARWLVPESGWPAITAVNSATGRQWYGKAPELPTVAECYQRIFNREITAILTGEPRPNGAAIGIQVMEALSGWALSCELRREVTVAEIYEAAVGSPEPHRWSGP